MSLLALQNTHDHLPSRMPGYSPFYLPGNLPFYLPFHLPGNLPGNLPFYLPGNLPFYLPCDTHGSLAVHQVPELPAVLRPQSGVRCQSGDSFHCPLQHGLDRKSVV